MKYCPYCGATLVDSAAPFCAECGKALPSPESPEPAQDIPLRPAKIRRPVPPKRKSVSREQPPSSIHSGNMLEQSSNHNDAGYDGYYNDVEPLDNAHTRDKMNPELLKRIIFVAAGALLIVILSVVLMYVL